MSLARDVEYAEGTIYNDEGRSTIPKEVRDRLGLNSGDEYVFVMEDDEIKVMEKSEFWARTAQANPEW